MPIYEFKCAKCDHVFDLLVFNSDDAEMKCPQCESPEVVKQMSTFSHTDGYSTLRTGSGGKGGVNTKSCGDGNSCTTIDIPGRT